jgi:Flp pilus assembly protein CpaB
MTTSIRDDKTVGRDSQATDDGIAPPPKLRRKPELVAIAIVAICLGAVVAGWTWSATTNTQEVLVARTDIERGSIIEESDLTTVRLSSDPALTPVSADEFESVVGQRAAFDIASGSAVTPGSFSNASLPPTGQSVVGVALSPAQAPGLALHSGDRVRVVVTPAQDGDAPGGTPEYSDAEVVAVHVDDETGETVVDLLVRHEDAAVLAARIATGHVALVLDSRDR